MDNILVYPAGFDGMILAREKNIFDYVPFLVQTVRDRRIDQPHWHDYLQIWYTVSGSFRLTANGKTYVQQPGSASLILPYMPHGIDTSDCDLSQTTVVSISVKKELLEAQSIPFLNHSYNSASFDSLLLSLKLTLSGQAKEQADRICLELLSEYDRNADMNTYKMISRLVSLLELFAKFSRNRLPAHVLAAARERRACMDEAMTFLHNNSTCRISLDEVSRAAMMSRRSFTSSFGEAVGQTCSNYIRAVRMQKAIIMMRKTEKSISEIAEECGFYDGSHFRQLCAELYGVSPTTLRRDMSRWTREYGDALYSQSIRNHIWAYAPSESSLERHRCAMSFY